jgi:hypothetical protein
VQATVTNEGTMAISFQKKPFVQTLRVSNGHRMLQMSAIDIKQDSQIFSTDEGI